MKCNQSPPGFELVSSCPIPTTITITPWLSALLLLYFPVLLILIYPYAELTTITWYSLYTLDLRIKYSPRALKIKALGLRDIWIKQLFI